MVGYFSPKVLLIAIDAFRSAPTLIKMQITNSEQVSGYERRTLYAVAAAFAVAFNLV